MLREHLLAASLFAVVNLWQLTPIMLAGLLATAFLTATGSIGVLVAAFDTGELAAMAFLIAGGIISAWTAVPVFALVRLPVFFAYIAMALAGSMLAGWGYAMTLA